MIKKKVCTKPFVFISVIIIMLHTVVCLIATETTTLSQKHKKFYSAGSELNINDLLKLDSLSSGKVKEVTVNYNMIRSRLEADWYYNSNQVGHRSMPGGMRKRITFLYNQALPGTFTVRFTGPTGHVQVTSVSAVIGKEAKKSTSEIPDMQMV
jgi:hypothetical protein